ncbi:hypothetical protein LEP1GSC172_3831 [Leptospira noguchii]|uniref:Uncharacterized protein n=1 Tax=Leptospira noguchii TaxID=28182 RepID=M6VB90_9LEPT|nr:hypothetical protein LEP1GSC172_3831 [Leptospira noguchii]
MHISFFPGLRGILNSRSICSCLSSSKIKLNSRFSKFNIFTTSDGSFKKKYMTASFLS